MHVLGRAGAGGRQADAQPHARKLSCCCSSEISPSLTSLSALTHVDLQRNKLDTGHDWVSQGMPACVPPCCPRRKGRRHSIHHYVERLQPVADTASSGSSFAPHVCPIVLCMCMCMYAWNRWTYCAACPGYNTWTCAETPSTLTLLLGACYASRCPALPGTPRRCRRRSPKHRHPHREAARAAAGRARVVMA